MNQRQFDNKYEYNRTEGNSNFVSKSAKSVSKLFSKDGAKQFIRRKLPFLKWMSNYNASYFVPDIIAGITVGIYTVPQAMSYATLAGLPPVYGLYASFFPQLIYAALGTANQTSIGVFSVTCMMINKCIRKVVGDAEFGKKVTYEDVSNITIIEVATSLCLLVGIYQTLMSLLRMDKCVKFLSEPAISAITFVCSVQGIISQTPKLLGFSVPSRDVQWFNSFYMIYDIAMNVQKTNLATLGITIFCFSFLMIMKTFVAVKLKKTRCGFFPLPSELFMIVLFVSISAIFDIQSKFGVRTIGKVPEGFPLPHVPRVDIWSKILTDAFAIAVVSYAVTVSMGQIFAKKYKYRVDTNQELLAVGMSNTVASFFSAFPISASMSRTLINEESGAKTQFACVISCCCVAIVILFVGPFLAYLPQCVLAVIVVVAVRAFLMKFTVLLKLWRYSKHDFCIWICTATFTFAADIAEGVAAGIIFAVLTIAIQAQQPTIKRLGKLNDNDYRCLQHYSSAKETPYCIIRFDAPLIFANVDKFLDNVRDASGCIVGEQWTAIILDCHTWTYTDSMGIDAIREIDEDLKKIKVVLLLANLKASLRRQYEHAGIMNQIHETQLFPSIHDALEAAEKVVYKISQLSEFQEPQ